MKPNKIYSVMDLARAARKKGQIFNPCFVGAPGLGKTEIIQQWCKDNKLKAIVITSALMDAPEIRGFPIVQIVNGRQRMTTATPDFWPDEGEGVVILEEVNRGTSSVMNCWMGLTDVRRGFDNYKLPEGWVVAACINPEGNEYETNAMDPALKDRFEMFNITYDKTTHLDYMKSTSYNKDIINFVESGIWTYRLPEEIGNVAGSKYISPRTLSKLNAAFMAGVNQDLEYEIIETVMGGVVAKDFYNFKYNETPVMMSDLNKNLKAALKKLVKFSDPNDCKNGMLSLTVRDILEDNKITDAMLIEVVKVLPVEKSTVLIRELEHKRNDETILSRLVNGDKEIKKLLQSVVHYGK